MAGGVHAQGAKAPLSALVVASLRRYRVRAMILAMRP